VAIFLLGPSKWAIGYSPPILPTWLVRHIPKGKGGAVTPSPFAVRKVLAGRLRLDGHKVIIMEEHPDLPGEPKAAKFSRLVRDEKVDRFVLYWPFGANRAGLDIEIGFILERLRRGEIVGEEVRVLIEDDGSRRRAGKVETKGVEAFTFVSHEKGHMTGYYGDLIPFRAILTTWANHEELFEVLRNIAIG
jgi:hypothetical protein